MKTLVSLKVLPVYFRFSRCFQVRSHLISTEDTLTLFQTSPLKDNAKGILRLGAQGLFISQTSGLNSLTPGQGREWLLKNRIKRAVCIYACIYTHIHNSIRCARQGIQPFTEEVSPHCHSNSKMGELSFVPERFAQTGHD